MEKRKMELLGAITLVFQQEDVSFVDRIKFFEYLVKGREGDDALKEFIVFSGRRRQYEIEPENLELINIYLDSFLSDFRQDSREKAAEEKPLDSKVMKETESIIYKHHLGRMKLAGPDSVLPLDTALNIFIGPPGEFNRYDRIEELENTLLSSPQIWQEQGVDYRTSLTSSKIEKRSLPGFYKELAAKVEWMPSEEAGKIIKQFNVSGR